MKNKILRFFVVILCIFMFVLSACAEVFAKITQTDRDTTQSFGIVLVHSSPLLSGDGDVPFGYRLDSRNAYRIYAGSNDFETTIICLDKDGKFPSETSTSGNYTSLGPATTATLNEANTNISAAKAKQILWVMNNAVLPEDSESMKNLKLSKIFANLIASTSNTENPITVADIKQYITEDDLVFAYQCAVWQSTNYSNVSNADNAEILNRVFQGNSTGNNNDWDGLDGNDRWGYKGRKGAYIREMIRYYINHFNGTESIVPTSASTAVNPKITNPTNNTYEKNGSKLFVGPFKIESSQSGVATVDYSVDITFRNASGTKISVPMNSTGYLLTTSASTSTNLLQPTKESLEGHEFYFAFPLNTTVRTIDIQLDTATMHSDTTGTVWKPTSGTDNQPLLSISRTEQPGTNVNTTYTFDVTSSVTYDVALRKYIAAVYRENAYGDWAVAYDGSTNGRKPVIPATPTDPFNQQNYMHRKDPVSVKIGDRVVYGIILYNEGETAVRISQIIDHLPPSGLQFIENRSQQVFSAAVNSRATKSGNNIIYSDSTNGYLYELDSGEQSPVIYFEFEVTSAANGKTVTNIAEITEMKDISGNPITNDIDSAANNANLPTTEDGWEEYSGNPSNKDPLNDENYYYKGYEDDDDFEKITVPLPDGSYDLTIVKVDSDTNAKLSGATFTATVNNTNKNVTESGTTGEYTLETIPISEVGTDRVIITETEAPSGYGKLVDSVPINVVKTINNGAYSISANLINTDNNVTLSQSGNTITVTIKNQKNPMDMALRKYITSIGGTEVSDSRVPNIDVSTLSSGTTALYKHRKAPLEIKTNDEIIYNITVYNEGSASGRVTKIIDQLPRGIEFVSVVGDVFTGTVDSNNRVTLTRKSSNTTNLAAYTSGQPKSETVQIKCKVTATATASEQVFTNVAWIAEQINADTGETIIEQTGKDRDSEPGTAPNVNQNNMENYTGKNNETNLDDANKYYEGQQDDDDFEKVKMEPASGIYNLQIIKVDDSDGNKKLSNAKFKVTMPDNTEVTLTTGDNGQIETSNINITSTGKETIKIQEMEAPRGYSKLIDSIEVEVTKALDGQEYKLTNAVLKVANSNASVTLNGQTIIVTIKDKKNSYDLALKKFITKVEGNQVPTRLQNVDTTPLKNGGHDATYTMDKSVVKVKKGDVVTYTIRIFNEGNTDAYAQIVKDDIPQGLKFLTDSEVNRTYRWRTENGKLVTDYLSREVNPDKQLKAFNPSTGEISYQDIQIEFEMVSTASKVIKNIAEIKEDDGDDGDSTPNNDVPEEDDEDYDNIIPLPYDLALKKFITGVTTPSGEKKTLPEDQQRSIEVTDVTALVNRDDNKADAQYKLNKTPVHVSKGDLVTYTIRIFNEGLQDGTAKEIEDTIPEGLEFSGYSLEGNEYRSGSRTNYKYGWKMYDANGNETTDTSKARSIKTTYLKDTIIPAFDGSKVAEENKGLSYADVQVEFKVVTDETKLLKNIAEITEDDGDDNDSTPDNQDPNEDDEDYDVVIPGRFDLSLRKFITKIDRVAVTDRVPNVDTTQLDSGDSTTAKYTHTKEPKVVVKGQIVTYTIRVYNEGTINGYAEEIKDDLPEGITFLPEHETNKEYGWKMYDANGNETNDVKKATNIRTAYGSKSSRTGKLLKAYNKDEMDEPDYIDVKATFEVTLANATATNKVIINTAEVSKDADEYGNDVDDIDSTPDNDHDGEDDIDKEYLVLKYFDLSLLKYVSKVIVTEDGVTKETETKYTGKENPEPIVKVELNKKKLAKTTVKYVYSIKITNEGEIEGYAKEIKDRIPDGLAFFEEDNKEYNWKVESEGIVTTDYLKDTLLKPGDSTMIPIVLRWKNSETNLGQKVNVAEISKDENPYGIPDIDSTPNNNKDGEDDQDNAIVLLSLKTGSGQTYFIIGIVIIAIVSTGVYAIKKFVL